MIGDVKYRSKYMFMEQIPLSTSPKKTRTLAKKILKNIEELWLGYWILWRECPEDILLYLVFVGEPKEDRSNVIYPNEEWIRLISKQDIEILKDLKLNYAIVL